MANPRACRRACLGIIPTAAGYGFRGRRQWQKKVLTVALLRFRAFFYRFLAHENLARPRNGIIPKQVLKEKILPIAFGVSGGLAGLALLRCSGATCTSCFGCTGIGAGMVLIALLKKLIPKKEG